ncbi:MAG: proline dehydrogenase, partial [Mucinivorans sp.]
MENITPQAVEQWAEGLLATCDKELTKAERSEQLKYATLIQNPTDKIFLSRLLDESSQIRDRARLAERIKVLIDKYGVPKFFSPVDSAMFKAYQWLGYKLDAVSVPIFKNRLRADTRAVIIDEARPRLTEH